MNRSALLLSLAALVGCSESQLQQIKGTGAEPDILVSPALIQFGATGSSATAEDLFTIETVGTAALQIDQVLVTGSDSFTLTVPSGLSSMAPGESADVVVTYAPRTGADSARAMVVSDDPDTPEATVELTGEVLYADLEIQPNPFDFGWVEPGDSTTGEVFLVNVGGEALTVDTLAVTGEAFSLLTSPTLPLELAPGDSAPVELMFSPLIHGDYEGSLWASHDGPTGTDNGALVGSTTQAAVSGRICDPSGDGYVAGALVWAGEDEDGDGELDWYVETSTDGDGRFTLEGVRAGTRTIHVDKGSFSVTFEVTVTGGTYELPEDECLSTDVKIAVVSGVYDDIARLLRDLGLDYDTYGDGTYLALLEDPDALAEYDIVFFNCGMSHSWLSQEDEVGANLEAFVDQGGSVYASDWAYGVIEAAWPWAVDWLGDDVLFNPETGITYGHLYPYGGIADTITADVIDPVMAAAVGGDSAELNYDLDAWVVPVGASSQTTVLLRGDARLYDEDTFEPGETKTDLPLAVRFSQGGTVIFTTFHNEVQITGHMELALKEIILSL